MDTAGESTEGFAPVRHLMYCAEQIIIPQEFPHILKTYAKAVIRTQPYDLLRWSAAYFRCMAAQVPPPVKQRLERDCRFGTLTRGYLRMLLEQLGKGFFVDRDVLQERWQALALPEDELLSFLSLCRQLHWPQVHWLKVFAVMVGSLNNTPLETLRMICELLTDDVEGSPCPIPMWMMRECYVFLSELDCGQDQCFVDGRKIIGENLLEEPTVMPDLPKLMALDTFRNAIVEKFNERLGIERTFCRQDYPYRLDEAAVLDGSNCAPRANGVDDVSLGSGADDSDSDDSGASQQTRPSHVSSSFRFIGDYADATQVIRRTPDFDSVILLLHEAQGYALHRYRGGHTVDDKTLRHAHRRDVELRQRREHQVKMVQQRVEQVTRHEHDRLLEDIEAPWSWVHRFAATAAGRDKSYNFLEFASIASDETPPASSDESFDFERSRFHRPAGETGESVDSCEAAIEEMLLKTPGADRRGEAAHGSSSDEDADLPDEERIVDVHGLLDDVMVTLERAVALKQLELQNTQSVATFMLERDGRRSGDDVNNDGSTAWSRAALTKEGKLNLAAVRVALRHAHEEQMVFETLEALRKYLEQELQLEPKAPTTAAAYAQSGGGFSSALSTGDNNANTTERLLEDRPMNNNNNNNNATTTPVEANTATTTATTLEQQQRTGGGDEATTTTTDPQSPAPLVDKFDDCQLEVEEKVLRKPLPTKMILGLVDTPPATPIVVPTPPRTPSEPPTTPHDTTSGIISSNVSVQEFPAPYAPVPPVAPAAPLPREPFRFGVPPMPGIGPAVSQKTIVDFVTYLTVRSRTEGGLVFPRHMLEEECPSAVDTFDDDAAAAAAGGGGDGAVVVESAAGAPEAN